MKGCFFISAALGAAAGAAIGMCAVKMAEPDIRRAMKKLRRSLPL